MGSGRSGPVRAADPQRGSGGEVLLRLLAAISIRLLQLGAGFLVYYGSTAMLTSDGLRPPNVIVLLGLLVVALATLSASRAEHRPLASLWVAAMVVWTVRRMSGRRSKPAHSMRPRPEIAP